MKIGSMQLSELIAELTEIYEEYGDIPCRFNRTVYTQVSSHTENAVIFVNSEHDEYKDPLKQMLCIEGI